MQIPGTLFWKRVHPEPALLGNRENLATGETHSWEQKKQQTDLGHMDRKGYTPNRETRSWQLRVRKPIHFHSQEQQNRKMRAPNSEKQIGKREYRLFHFLAGPWALLSYFIYFLWGEAWGRKRYNYSFYFRPLRAGSFCLRIHFLFF